MSDTLPKTDPSNLLMQLDEPAARAKLQSDAELLELYVHGGDRQAIDHLVQRYAPMVASVCRLTVADVSSAEDAFQATFLILLKSAHKIHKHASLAAWLHGVAYRTASRIRQKGRQQLLNEGRDDVIKISEPSEDPIAKLARKMELEALDRELEKLPDSLRAPLVEHYLLGYTAPEIAQRMELSTTAVEGRLKRGRRKLRSLLAQRGISLSVLVAGSELFQRHLQAAEAADWTSNFLDEHLPTGELPNEATSTASSSPEVSSLVQGEMSMISVTSVKVGIASGIILVAGTLAVLANDPLGGSNGGRTPSAASNSQTYHLPSKDHSEGHLAQFGSAPAGLGQAAAAGATPPGANAPGAAPRIGRAPGLAQPPGQTAAPADELAPTNAPPVEWQRPDSEGDPIWLAGGKTSMESMDANRAVLARQLNFEFHRLPLREAANFLTDQTGTTFEINMNELDLLGVDPDTTISLYGECSIREFLRRTLDPLELTYQVTESTIEITSKDAADANPRMRFYDLAYILPNASNADAVISAVQQSIDPDSWLAAGGTSSSVMVGSMLIVSAPDSTHQKIEILLMNLSTMNPKNVETAPSGTGIVPGMGAGGLGLGGGGGGMGGGGMF